MPVMGLVCLKGPTKILFERSSIYRKFSNSLTNLAKQRDWKMYFWIQLLIGREENYVTECCEAWVTAL
jgi:hypothetical protein